MMTNKIKNKFDLLDKDLEDLFQLAAKYNHDQLNKKPANDSWSAIQTMHHLILVETATLQYLKKKMSYNPTLKKAGLSSSFREIAVWLFLRTPMKIKAPKIVSDSIPATADLEETKQLWVETRKELRAFLNALPESAYDKEIFKHALAGKMSLNGMMIFFRDHFGRHHKQILKALK